MYLLAMIYAMKKSQNFGFDNVFSFRHELTKNRADLTWFTFHVPTSNYLVKFFVSRAASHTRLRSVDSTRLQSRWNASEKELLLPQMRQCIYKEKQSIQSSQVPMRSVAKVQLPLLFIPHEAFVECTISYTQDTSQSTSFRSGCVHHVRQPVDLNFCCGLLLKIVSYHVMSCEKWLW